MDTPLPPVFLHTIHVDGIISEIESERERERERERRVGEGKGGGKEDRGR